MSRLAQAFALVLSLPLMHCGGAASSTPRTVPLSAGASEGETVAPVAAAPAAPTPSTCEAIADQGAIDRDVHLAAPGGRVDHASAFFGVARAPLTSTSTAIGVELHAPAQAKAGEPLKLAVGFRNQSGGPVVLMQALDGSFVRWRFPYYDLYARDLGTGQLYRFAYVGGRCGNVNAIGEADYRALPAGAIWSHAERKGFDSHLETATIGVPGDYEIWLAYAYCGHRDGGLTMGEDLVRPAEPGVFVSPPVRVRVR